jgi:hypothetical protein
MKEDEVVENFVDDLPPLDYDEVEEETKEESETQATKSEESDKDIPALEEPVAEAVVETKPISANIVKYDSSSDEEQKPVKQYYNDLEELD